MELDRVEKPLRQMRKLLKSLPQDPAPEQVHKLRTRARRIEAVADALEPDSGKKTRRLIKALKQAIKPVRKAAGGVRDMDVLTGNLLTMPQGGGSDALVRLIEHLGSTRRASAAGLLDAVERQRKPARRELKKYARLVESVATGKKPVRMEAGRTFDAESGSDSAAGELLGELRRWPALNAQNLHSFRLKVKALRYVLQMFSGSDQEFAEALRNVKDQIGDWHDWQRLLDIAGEVLDERQDAELLAQIDKTAKLKFTHALAAANALRGRYLHAAAKAG